MKIKRLILFLLMLQFLLLNSCVEEYWPEVSKYENLIVVEGGINNLPGPYTIKISKSSPIDSAAYAPIKGCTVKISDDNGSVEVLTEVEDGVYLTDPNGIRGEVGSKYRLEIETPQGKSYKSTFDELLKPVLIDKVYAETEFHNDPKFDHQLAGYQFYVDTEVTNEDHHYYLWQMEATFHFQSEFGIRWYWDGHLKPFNPSDSLFNCWSSYKVKNIYTFNTSSLTSNKLDHFALNYVNTETKQLTKRYSLLVKQYTINKTAYQFWNAIEQQNAEQGSLYSHQPYQIRGNVKNINNDNEPVLGYFMVSGVDTKRIFVDKILGVPFYYSRCEINDGNYKAYQEIGWTDPSEFPVYVILYDGRRAVPGQPCADCRQNNGSIVKPDFWEE